jgi:hypothetical protein
VNSTYICNLISVFVYLLKICPVLLERNVHAEETTVLTNVVTEEDILGFPRILGMKEDAIGFLPSGINSRR